jgi:hypothetical protein
MKLNTATSVEMADSWTGAFAENWSVDFFFKSMNLFGWVRRHIRLLAEDENGSWVDSAFFAFMCKRG